MTDAAKRARILHITRNLPRINVLPAIGVSPWTGDVVVGTVNGAFISTTQAKGAATGRLLSVVRFFNPRAVDDTVYLEVLSGFQFVSL